MTKKVLSLTMALGIALTVSGCKWLHAKEAKQEKPVLAVIHLETFVVNLADEGQRTFLRAGIDLGVVSEKTTKESETKPVAPIRDVILGVLMATKSEDMATSDGKKRLKEEILKALNDKLPELQTREVYFTEFLLQQ
ncbi:MAG: flagellar basal body-associated FliL family protein [Terriglobia bacterium]|nr:flagellar basal body-associated FliL family protein [Terriglobia bacterium]